MVSGQWIIIQDVDSSSVGDVDCLGVDDKHSVGREFGTIAAPIGYAI